VQLIPRQAFKKGGETAACPQPTAKGHWLLKSAQTKKNVVSFAFACHIFATILHTSGETAACHKPKQKSKRLLLSEGRSKNIKQIRISMKIKGRARVQHLHNQPELEQSDCCMFNAL
jgi:hypothetical protein